MTTVRWKDADSCVATLLALTNAPAGDAPIITARARSQEHLLPTPNPQHRPRDMSRRSILGRRTLSAIQIVVQLSSLLLILSSIIFPHLFSSYDTQFYTPTSYHAVAPACDQPQHFAWYDQDKHRCTPQGVVMERTNIRYVDEMTLFANNAVPAAFGDHYAVEVDTLILQGDYYTCTGLGVDGTTSGSLVFYVCQDGEWTVFGFGSDGSVQRRYAVGFQKNPQPEHHLRITDNGPAMTFSLDQQPLVTLPIAPASSTGDVTLVLGNTVGDAAYATARFAHFAYTSTQDPSILTSVPPPSQTAYQAPVPGYGCDTGAGQWSEPQYQNVSDTAIDCGQHSMTFATSTNSTYITRERFYNHFGDFATDYAVSVQIDLTHLAGGCAGIETNEPEFGTKGLAFYVCADHTWQVVDYQNADDTIASGTLLDHGVWRGAPLVNLQTTTLHGTASFQINGRQVSIINDPETFPTKHIDLVQYTAVTSGGSADYSQFVYTPLAG